MNAKQEKRESGPLAERIESVRRFNRFYTRHLGLLQEGQLYAPFSLTEARVLYELAHRDRPAASDLAQELNLDPGYLSRLLARFAKQGLLQRSASQADGRRSLLALTAKGHSAFASLNAKSLDSIGGWLRGMPAPSQGRLVRAMNTVESLLVPPDGAQPYLLRTHQPGDMGWVIGAHGALYFQEYGWDITFELLVAEIAAQFLKTFDPARERCWIAELDGEPVGSVFLVKHSATVGKLRLLIVDPRARGLGIGRRLVEECIRFARGCGYRKVTLWTNSVLTAARAIYQQTGFERISEEPHHSFGKDLVGEEWELKL
jgi:DNA-binding MarR family transcriptional regulator/GNAT superfamily N-acetyltransferase